MELEQLAEELANLKQGMAEDRFNSARNSWYDGVGSPLRDEQGIGDLIFSELYNSGDYTEQATFALAEKLRQDIDKVSAAVKMLAKKLPDTMEKLAERAEKLEDIVTEADKSNKVDDAVSDVETAMNDLDTIDDDLGDEAPPDFEGDMGGEAPMGDAGMGADMGGVGAEAGAPMGDAGMGADMGGADMGAEAPMGDAGMGDAGMGADMAGADMGSEAPMPEEQGTMSDERMKSICRGVVSDLRLKKKRGTIPAHIIAASRGAF